MTRTSLEALRELEARYAAAREHPLTGDTSLDVFLTSLPAHWSRLLVDLSAPHWFDREIAAALLDDRAYEAQLSPDLSATLPFVHSHPRGFSLHDTTRNALRRYLLRSDPERARRDCARVAETLAATPQPRDEEVEQEILYCRLACDPDAVEDLRERFNRARYGRQLARCRALLALVEEQDPLLDAAGRVKLHFLRGLLAYEDRSFEVLDEEFGRVEASEDAPPLLRGKVALYRGMALEAAGRWQAAAAHYRGSIEWVRARGITDRVLHSALHHHLAQAELRLGELSRAEANAKLSLELNLPSDDALGLSRDYDLLGQIHQRLSEPRKAKRFFQRSLAAAGRLGTRYHKARVLNNYASLLVEQEELEEAREAYLEALEIRNRMGDSLAVAMLHLNLAGLERRREKAAAALERYALALNILEGVRAPLRTAQVLRQRASLLASRGDFESAVVDQARAVALIPPAAPAARAAQEELRRYERAGRAPARRRVSNAPEAMARTGRFLWRILGRHRPNA